ncbi:hypothetical protein GcM3_075030 [Golovinomyces cichoracearum]|uniref:Uncharacterized protein n=1 Tax=Golovinomyces cichoracearum TaxID=62708 RepID=A0A420IR10_9PEZI|nr:hypothetical protein GcM3_075030 [Golovinomyces cichoracearum]
MAFQKVNHTEMDLSFKFFKGKTKIYSINSWDEVAKRTNTYVYAFINTDTMQAYATMFREVFRVLGEVGRFLVQVDHIQ